MKLYVERNERDVFQRATIEIDKPEELSILKIALTKYIEFLARLIPPEEIIKIKERAEKALKDLEIRRQ